MQYPKGFEKIGELYDRLQVACSKLPEQQCGELTNKQEDVWSAWWDVSTRHFGRKLVRKFSDLPGEIWCGGEYNPNYYKG